MATQPERAVLTIEDWLALPDDPSDRNRYEILEGELAVTPPPNMEHQGASAALFGIVYPHVRERRLGKVYHAPTCVALSRTTGVNPDLVFVATERLGIIGSRVIEGAPDLVVEILSPSNRRRDLVEKRELYARLGVANYWIVDPKRRTAEAYVLESGAYRLAVAARENETFTAPPFPDLAIPLAELWG